MHPDDIAHEKAALRLRARAARRAVVGESRLAAARAIAERVLALTEIDTVGGALLYGAAPEEIDPSALEAALRTRGVRVAYPRVAGPHHLSVHWVDDPDALVGGSFGLKEPAADAPEAPLHAIDLVIVPGVAFDEHGRRLGFGGAYYDALLAGLGPDALTIGVAFDEQVVEACPAEEHDRAVDVLVTPARTVRCPTTRP